MSDSRLKAVVTSAEKAVSDWKAAKPSHEVEEQYVQWGKVPGIQAPFFMRGTTHLVNEILSIRGAVGIGSLFYECKAQEKDQIVHPIFLTQEHYFDSNRHLFILHSGASPNYIAIDVGQRTVAPWDGVIDDSVADRWEEITKSSADFVNSFHPNGEWGIPVEPDGPPSVLGTLSALSALRSCANHLGKLGYKVVDHDRLNVIAKRLISTEDIRYDKEGYFAFVQPGLDKGCLSTTEQMFRICRILDNLSAEHDSLDSVLRDKSRGVLEFIKSCWDQESGGFCVNPEKSSLPNLSHTRTAFQLLRTLLIWKTIDHSDINDWLDLGAVVRFTDSCRSGNGYANIPGAQPSILSLRDALSVTKMALIFRMNVIGKPDSDLTLIPLLANEITDVANRFPQKCIDFDTGKAFMYEVDAIYRWSSEHIEASTENGKSRERKQRSGAHNSSRIYSRDEIKKKSEYYGRILELDIRGYTQDEISQKVGVQTENIVQDLKILRDTIRSSNDDFEIIWNDLHLPGRFDWQPTTKGRKYLESLQE